MPDVPAFRRLLRQEDYREFQTSLGYGWRLDQCAVTQMCQVLPGPGEGRMQAGWAFHCMQAHMAPIGPLTPLFSQSRAVIPTPWLRVQPPYLSVSVTRQAQWWYPELSAGEAEKGGSLGVID